MRFFFFRFDYYSVEKGWSGIILSYFLLSCWICTFELLYRRVVFRGGKSGTRDEFRGFCGHLCRFEVRIW